MRRKKYILIFAVILLFIISFIGSKGELVENLEIPVGVGIDIEKSAGETIYDIPIMIFNFQDNGQITSSLMHAKAPNIGETREIRQVKSSKKYLLGLTRVFVFSEDISSSGVRNVLDILFNNPDINDQSACVICKGKAADILNYKVNGYTTSAEYIDEMIKNLNDFSFTPKQYSLTDMIVRMNLKDRTTMLPYIEITSDGLRVTGYGVFTKDKLSKILNINEAKVINLLKENNVKGMLALQKDSKKYINFYATSKRKVSCSKQNGKYVFTIKLKLKGDIVSNELYGNMNFNNDDIKRFESDLSKSVKNMCLDMIYKMQNVYKMDMLDLGRVASAYYGANSDANWNKIISDSIINVDAKVIVDKEGRGDY